MSLRLYILMFSLLTGGICQSQDTTKRIEVSLGKISFVKTSTRLTVVARAQLRRICLIIAEHPGSIVLATSYSADLCSRCGALGWDRVQAVLFYLKKIGVSEDKLMSTNCLGENQNFIALSLSFQTSAMQPPANLNAIFQQRQTIVLNIL